MGRRSGPSHCPTDDLEWLLHGPPFVSRAGGATEGSTRPGADEAAEGRRFGDDAQRGGPDHQARRCPRRVRVVPLAGRCARCRRESRMWAGNWKVLARPFIDGPQEGGGQDPRGPIRDPPIDARHRPVPPTRPALTPPPGRADRPAPRAASLAMGLPLGPRPLLSEYFPLHQNLLVGHLPCL